VCVIKQYTDYNSPYVAVGYTGCKVMQCYEKLENKISTSRNMEGKTYEDYTV